MQKKTAIISIVSAVIVALLAAGLVWFFWDDVAGDERADDFAPAELASPVACEGGLFDSHMHLDNDDYARTMARQMQSNGVTCGLLFVQMDLQNMDMDILRAREELGDAPARFIPFFDIIKDRSTRVTTSQLESLASAYGGTFKGFGEFALYRPEQQGTDLTAEPWPTIFDFAAERDLVVMIHLSLDAADQAGLETMLDRYPQTKVLIHGFERGGAGFAALLTEHPNLYFTLDTATLLKEGTGPGLHLMYPSGQGSAQTFVEQYTANKSRLLEQAQDEWAQVIVAAPDRVMWGTDVSFDWHADPDVYSRLIEFSNEFIATLPAEVQDKYRFQNAVRLLGTHGTMHESLSEAELDRLDDLEPDQDEED